MLGWGAEDFCRCEGELSVVAEEGSAVCHNRGGFARRSFVRGDVSFFESPDGAIGGCVMEDFCIAVVLEVGDCSVVVEELVEVFGGGSFCEISGSDEDEFSFVFQMEDGFVDKKQIEVGAAIESRGGGGSMGDGVGMSVGGSMSEGIGGSSAWVVFRRECWSASIGHLLRELLREDILEEDLGWVDFRWLLWGGFRRGDN